MTKRTAFICWFMLLASVAFVGLQPHPASAEEGAIAFNEVMYHPATADEALEWVELYNQMTLNIDLSGWSITGGISYTFPNGTVMTGGSYLVIARQPAALQADTGTTGVLGPFGGRLSNDGERLELHNATGRLMNTLEYGNDTPWPAGADGSGFSLAKGDPADGSNQPKNWRVSAQRGGTPGKPNFLIVDGVSTRTLAFPIDATWKFNDSGFDLGSTWRAIDYNDSSWSSGAALIKAGTVTIDRNSSYPETNPASSSGKIANASFEDGPVHAWPGYGTLDGWTCNGGTGNNTLSDPFLNGLPVPDGLWIALIQVSGSISQTISGLIPGQNYMVQYWENERGMDGNPGGPHARPAATLGGKIVVPEHDDYRTQRFRRVISQPFKASAATTDLALSNNAANFGDNTVLFDDVKVLRAAPVVVDGNFEQIFVSSYGPPPAGFTWQTTGGINLGQSGCAFGNTAYEGSQALIMQYAGSISRTVSGFEVGQSYVLNWAEADRGNDQGSNDLRIKLDDQELVAQHVVNTGWTDHRSPVFIAQKTSYKLTFESLGGGGGDRSLFLDDIRLSLAPEPPPSQTISRIDPMTTYFRKTFQFTGDPANATLMLNTVVDDGAVFYLNGTEIHRINMPGGTINALTGATTEVGNPSFTGAIELPGQKLIQGTNVLSVEVHKATAASPGKLFGAELNLLQLPPDPNSPPPVLTINEVSGAGVAPFWLELKNNSTAPLDLTGYKIGTNQLGILPFTFAARSLGAGQYLTLTQTDIGFAPRDGDKIFVYAPNDQQLVDTAKITSRLRGRYPDGLGPWLYEDRPTSGATNSVKLHDEVVIDEIMYHPRPLPASDAVYQTNEYIALDAQWKYFQLATDPAANWRDPDFDDTAWPAGKGLLYVEDADLGVPKNTPLTIGQTTYYFRTEFTFDGDPSRAQLKLQHYIDDGAVFYLNGQEIYRYNMPLAPAEITRQTLASGVVDNAPLQGPFDLPSAALHVGRNVLAVEVHQSSTASSDIVFGARLYAQELVKPAQPYTDSVKGYLELYNRSKNAVDLTGWRFTSGIDFTFTDGTVLAPGEYAIVAQNTEAMRADFSNIRILGQYTGKLSHSHADLVLTDSFGNPADEVEYYDGGRWPSYADGGGSSLELRDPWADNNQAEAWVASDEGLNSQWKTYTYQGVAAYPPGTNYPNLWHDFVLGLMTEGEVLLDDISVIEDPNGQAHELIQNGNFTNGLDKWRILGTHHATVEKDATDTSNSVMRLTATGATEHAHNHCETTFVNNTAVVPGREYKVSFRARWLAGSNQLNTRLYFNYLPRINMLEIPAKAGTPGAPNTHLETNIGPTYSNLTNTPVVPAANAPVTVSVQAADPDGVNQMILHWRADGKTWNTSAMADAGNGRYSGVIPGQARATVMQFYVEGMDGKGAQSFFPAAGPDSHALYIVDDGRGAKRLHHTMRIVMLSADNKFMSTVTNMMSNEYVKCTIVYDERKAWYEGGVRYKGAGYSRSGSGAGFHLEFSPDNLFRGEYQSIAIDIGAGFFGMGASQAELLVKKIIEHAGGVPCFYDDVVRVISPDGVRDWLGSANMNRYSSTALDSIFPPKGSDGDLYKFELIYYSTITTDGNPESLKMPPGYNAVVPTAVELTDLGNNKEDYRWWFISENNHVRDNYSRIMEMGKTFSLNGAALDKQSREVLDLDEWMKMFCMEALFGVVDTYHYGLAHNIEFFVRPTDNKVVALPWDDDICFYFPTDANIYGQGSNLSKVIQIPANKRLYLGHMLDVIDTTFNNTYLDPWIGHYNQMTDYKLDDMLKSYIRDRGNYVKSQLPAKVPFTITTNGGADFAIPTNRIAITGTGWINVRQIFIAGRPDPLDLTWSTLSGWQAQVPLAAGVNTLNFQAFDFQGNLIGSKTITIHNTSTDDPLFDHLRITEIMPAPADSDDFEFIELHNTDNTTTLSLGGVTFTNGITYTFPDDATIGPNGYLVLSRTWDTNMFRAHYGLANTVPVIGGYPNKLSNSGEHVTLLTFSGGKIIASFNYSDDRGWPAAAFGAGHSLVPLDAAVAREPAGSLEYGGNWRPSTFNGGSPGAPDAAPPASLVINEIMANTRYADAGNPGYDSNDWIELYNTGASGVSTANWFLSDSAAELRKWALPTLTIPPGQRVSFDEVTGFHHPLTTGFNLNKDGERLFLSYLPGATQDRVVDAVRYAAQAPTWSLSRCNDGDRWWYASLLTRDTVNKPADMHLYINEIMYQPKLNVGQTDNTADEYIELYNSSAAPLPLSNELGAWRLAGNVSYSFPAGFSIPPYGWVLLVGFDTSNASACTNFLNHYGINSTGVTLLGPWSGSLSNIGGRIAVEWPQTSNDLTNPIAWGIADEVIFFNQTPWASGANATGQSLQRLYRGLSGNEPTNWQAHSPTPGRYNPGQSSQVQMDWTLFR